MKRVGLLGGQIEIPLLALAELGRLLLELLLLVLDAADALLAEVLQGLDHVRVDILQLEQDGNRSMRLTGDYISIGRKGGNPARVM